MIFFLIACQGALWADSGYEDVEVDLNQEEPVSLDAILFNDGPYAGCGGMDVPDQEGTITATFIRIYGQTEDFQACLYESEDSQMDDCTYDPLSGTAWFRAVSDLPAGDVSSCSAIFYPTE